jgi:hypothetical protein
MVKKRKIKLNTIDTHIDALIDNLDEKKIYKNIDLVLDGGLFNGGYQIGSALYLKKLENKKLISIERISGCSIGSFVGFCYLSNNMHECINNYENLLKCYRENNNLIVFKELLYNVIVKSDYSLDKINNKLFITYHEVKNTKKITKSIYENKEELYETIIKSCFIPFMINDEYYYKGNYLDGITPYIFEKNNNKIIFIKLLSFDKLLESFIIKNENNIITRLLTGIVDIDNLFHNKNTQFCSYLDSWKMNDYINLRLRNIFFIFVVYTIEYIIKIYNNIPVKIRHSYIIENIYVIIKYIYRDFLKSHVL